MDTLLSAITKVENELILVESLIRNIFIFDLPKGELVINLRFSASKDKDPKIIGGLAATISEFAGLTNGRSIRSISLEELNILFVSSKEFLIVFAVDPNYPDEQFIGAVLTFISSFETCMRYQDYGSSIDGAAIAVQTIHNLISEDIKIEVRLGTKVTIYPVKLKEIANETANQLLRSRMKQQESDLYDDTETLDKIKAETKPVVSGRDTLKQMLSQFLGTFADTSEITLIRTNIDGTFEKFSESRLDDTISSNIYDIVNNMIDTVSLLLEGPLEDRIIELDNEIILFYKVSDLSFIYLVLSGKDTIEFIEPIIDRISSSISGLFPDDSEI